MHSSIWIGFDPREADGFAVTRFSARRRSTKPIPIYGIVLNEMKRKGMFWRPQERRDGRIWDLISEAPCATEFSISRFLVPLLAKKSKWAMFCDSDMMFRSNPCRVFEDLKDKYAVYCVKHNHQPVGSTKMDGQIQTTYSRKNWSSLMIFNNDHPANEKLTLDMVNFLPGRDLHNFCWLSSDEEEKESLIGELPESWNWLAGHSSSSIDPDVVHFTEGLPSMPGYEQSPYAEQWWEELGLWATKS